MSSTLIAWAKSQGYNRLSHSVQAGKDTGFPCLFAMDKTGIKPDQVIMVSKGLQAEGVEPGTVVRALWDNPVTTTEEGRVYVGRPQYDDIE